MTAVPVEWIVPPSQGWTYDQVKEFDLPYDWELVDGVILPRGQTNFWHDQVRDGLCAALREARKHPFAVNVERCVLFDEETVTKPDVVVFDKIGLNVFELECLPVDSMALAVEVVSHGTRRQDRFSKPAIYAEAQVPRYWRVERGAKDFPIVHEFRLDEESGVYAPVAEHIDVLAVTVPYPIRVDLKAIMEL